MQFLSVAIVLLFAIPADLVIVGAGAAGSPSVVLGLIALLWWLLERFALGTSLRWGFNPVRAGLLCFAAVVLASWVTAWLRPLSAAAASQADRSLIVLAGMWGFALLAMDGIRTRRDVERVASVVVGASMLMVTVGIVQFAFRVNPLEWVRIPGLVFNEGRAEALESRSVFTRPRGTALHPIEFGVVTAALLPYALWVRTVKLPHRRAGSFDVWGVALVALAFGAMISLSRSAVLAIGVAGIVVLLNASWRQRLNLLALGVLLFLAAGVVVDGLIGTITGLFTQAADDSSVQARLDRTPEVFRLIAEYPWFGRGFGTYTISDFQLLDNELQRTAIETGFVGVTVLVLFMFSVVAVAWRVRRRSYDLRLAGTALAASVLGLFISSYTFDAFFYRILTTLLYLSIGLVGAVWRLSRTETATGTDTESAATEPVAVTARSGPHVSISRR